MAEGKEYNIKINIFIRVFIIAKKGLVLKKSFFYFYILYSDFYFVIRIIRKYIKNIYIISYKIYINISFLKIAVN